MSTVATRKPTTVVSELERVKPFLAETLPSQVTPERFTRLALTTLRKTPKLQQTSPESFVGALYTAAALGLEPDVNGECYLVPYGRETQLIVGYQGLAKLFWQHPLAARLSAEYVCANDDFDYDKGLNPYLRHKPAVGERGEVVAYYAIVGLKNGATWFDVLSPAQVKALRGKVRPSNIADPEHWMDRKTVLKQVLKLAPKSTELHNSMVLDQQPGRPVDQLAPSLQGRIATPEIEPPTEQIDPDTGEVLDGELMPLDEPNPAYDDAKWLAGGAQ